MLADADMEAEVARLEAALGDRRGPTVLVSNEVEFGIVPDNALARRFRDLQGGLISGSPRVLTGYSGGRWDSDHRKGVSIRR